MADQAYGRAPVLKSVEDPDEKVTFKDEDLFIDVLTASMGGDSIFRTVNLPNIGQAANLPYGAVLESTTLINGDGFQPLCFGDLPLGIRAILMRILGVAGADRRGCPQGRPQAGGPGSDRRGDCAHRGRG